MSKKIHVFAVEGNIGAGKTTFLKQMMQLYPEFHYCFEPISDWQNVNYTDGSPLNMLEKANKNPKRNAFPFQMITLTTQLHYLNNLERYGSNVVITERSVLSNRNVFALSLKDKGILGKGAWASYDYLLNNLLPKDFEYSGFVYLNTKPEICLERVMKRDRHEERKLSLRYLRKIDFYHRDLLLRRDDVLMVDNSGMKENVSDFGSLYGEVDMFIKGKISDPDATSAGSFCCCGTLDDFNDNLTE